MDHFILATMDTLCLVRRVGFFEQHLTLFLLGIAVVDGEFMPYPPQKMLQEGNHKKNFTLLISTVQDEASFMFYYYPPLIDPRFAKQCPSNLTLTEARKFLETQIVQYTGETIDATFDLANRLYYENLNKSQQTMDMFRRQTGIAFGDLVLSCPTILFGREIFRSSPNSIRVYQAYFTFKMGPRLLFCSNWGGTCHTDDVFYLFSINFNPRSEFYSRQQEISNEIVNFLSSFIRTGLV